MTNIDPRVQQFNTDEEIDRLKTENLLLKRQIEELTKVQIETGTTTGFDLSKKMPIGLGKDPELKDPIADERDALKQRLTEIMEAAHFLVGAFHFLERNILKMEQIEQYPPTDPLIGIRLFGYTRYPTWTFPISKLHHFIETITSIIVKDIRKEQDNETAERLKKLRVAFTPRIQELFDGFTICEDECKCGDDYTQECGPGCSDEDTCPCIAHEVQRLGKVLGEILKETKDEGDKP